MNTILYHPRHGTKVAISQQEIAADILRGWCLEPPPSQPAVEEHNALRRRGRPRKEEVQHGDSR